MSRKLNLANAALLGRATARAVSLFGVDDARSLREIDVDQIEPNPNQPRRHFDEDALATLAQSIERHGLLQPICVREVDADCYQIIAGERRYRAARRLNWATIPAIVTRTDDPAALAMIENIQREDLDAVELARGLHALLAERGASHQQLGALIGKSQAYVTRVLGILNLPASVLDAYGENRHVPVSALMIVAEAGDEANQLALWELAKEGLSVRQLQESRKAALGAAGLGKSGRGRPKAEEPPAPAPASVGADPAVDALVKAAAILRDLRRDGTALPEARRRALADLRDAIDAVLAG